MHEMSIAMEMVTQLVELAERHQASRIVQVEVVAGAMRGVVPEALDLAFAAASEGTPAEGAELCVVEEKLQVVCNDCGFEFAPEPVSFLCPQCRQADVRIVAGNDIILKSVVCDTPEGVPGS
jgi:hydrogenase nickel incorporation protein HypA/HybF